MAVLASDSFTGGDVSDINGRTTDSALGGSGKVWGTSGGTRLIRIGSGAAVNGLGAGTANAYAFDAGSGDVWVTMTVNSVTTSTQSLTLMARQATSLATITYYRVLISVNSGVLQMAKVVAGTPTNLGSAQTWTAGDVIGLRCNGTTIEMTKNGTTLVSVTDTAIPNTNTKVGLRPTATATFSVDDFTVTSTAAATDTGFLVMF